ncbi:hypothetical protein HDU82_000165 [Entophlyctis luteolus]|nr:hypothetical protein HDU82_000165 [Entophlyctis luteolus]
MNVHPACVTSAEALPCPKRPAQPSLAEEIAAQTIIASVAREHAARAANPPLDLVYTTPKNLATFVPRISLVVDAFDFIERVLSWKDSALSLLMLLVLLIRVIVMNYLALTRAKLLSSSSTVTATTVTSAAVTYARNLQFIQNQMSQFVSIHDLAVLGLQSLLEYADAQPIYALAVIAVSGAVTLFVASVVPARAVALCIVIAAFMKDTVRIVARVVAPAVVARAWIVFEGLSAAVRAPEGCVVEVEVWENQRWWAGLGWIQHLFRAERSPWSDETGTIPRPHKDQYALPPAVNGVGTWAWINNEWTIDREVDGGDKDGWVYSGNMWEKVASGKPLVASVATVTRRRRWTRCMRFVPAFAGVGRGRSVQSSPKATNTQMRIDGEAGERVKDAGTKKME